MRNCDFIIGAVIGAVIAGAVTNCRKEKEINVFPCCCKEKPKRKPDPCKDCYYEFYERRPCK